MSTYYDPICRRIGRCVQNQVLNGSVFRHISSQMDMTVVSLFIAGFQMNFFFWNLSRESARTLLLENTKNTNEGRKENTHANPYDLIKNSDNTPYRELYEFKPRQELCI